MNTVLNPSPEDDDTTEILIVENSETHQLNKFQVFALIPLYSV